MWDGSAVRFTAASRRERGTLHPLTALKKQRYCLIVFSSRGEPPGAWDAPPLTALKKQRYYLIVFSSQHFSFFLVKSRNQTHREEVP